jgi:hypothetical protein
MKIKNKRIPLSIIRLYKLASKFSNGKTAQTIMDFLKYINEHKNDTL